MANAPDYTTEVDYLDSTPKSWKVQFDHLDEPVFVPKSQCELGEISPDKRVEITIRGWLADKNDWRY